MHPLHDYLCGQLDEMLKKRGIVVFYDPRCEFEPFFDRELKETGTGYDGLPRVFIGERLTFLARFDGSFFALRAAVEPIASLAQPDPLIVYLPGVARDRQGSVLMELEKAGSCYEPQLKRLALNVLRKTFTDGQIDELFRSASVGYDEIVSFLRQAEEGKSASVLRTIFEGVQSEDLLTHWLADDSKDKLIAEKDAAGELFKLIETRVGFEVAEDSLITEARNKTGRYVLVNEFRSDLACEPPTALGMVPVATEKEQLERIRNIAESLRHDHPDRYAKLANQVESELNLGTANVDPDNFGDIDTFNFEERALLARAGELIAKRKYDGALGIVVGRRRSFWADRDVTRQAQWEACRLMAELGVEIERVHKCVDKTRPEPAKWVEAYTQKSGWHEADRLHRTLETWISKMDDEPEAENALGVVRRDYEDLLKKMAERFSDSLRAAGFMVPGCLHQTRIYPEVVEGLRRTRAAYFWVDAMRYEMGVELSQLLSGAEEVTVQPAIAALPTITPIGMAALLPGASSSFSVVEAKGKIAARIEDSVMPAINARQKYLKASVPDVLDLPLWDVLSKSKAKLKRQIGDSSFLLVRSQDIDTLGEGGEDWLARQLMDTVIGNICRAVRKLAGLGVESFVISADHGYQFALKKEGDMKIDNPGGDVVSPHRRCWAGRGGRTPPGCIRVTGAELGYETDLDFIFPAGLAVFSAQGGLSYHHGGLSLQELVVPVITLRFPPGKQPAPPASKAELKQHPEAITNRTFGILVRVGKGLFDVEPLSLRVILLSGGEQVGQAGMSLGGEFDRETGCVLVQPGEEASIGMMLRKDDCKRLRVVVLDAQTDAVLDQSEELPVKLGI